MSVAGFLTRRKGKNGLELTDYLAYAWLAIGVVMMFGPALWLGASSFKTRAALKEFPPTFLPIGQKEVQVAGQDRPLPAYTVKLPDGTARELLLLRRIGLQGQFVDPANPSGDIVRAPVGDAQAVRVFQPAFDNFVEPMRRFRFDRFLTNSVIVTIVSTIITLLINSMCAFALSKYDFRGRNAIFVFILTTLMIPISVILVPAFLVVTSLGMTNSLWGVILPPAATPTGIFLLRQYMLTIPDELIDAARMDAATEWRVYSRIILPLAAPAIAVLAIFSVIWRWNDFLWPLIVLNREEVFTLQLGLASFQGELDTQWNYLLAMTVVTLLPVIGLFLALQKHIVTGIASSGMK